MSSVDVISFGCRLNLAEGEAIRAAASAVAASERRNSDIIVINGCAVTAEAERQARQAIRQAARRNPAADIVVTGCIADTKGASFAAMPEVTRILSNRHKHDAAAWRGDDMAAPAPIRPAISGRNHARAFVEVQNGCDHSCTFCIIPQGRGPSRSVPPTAVIAAVRDLVDAGQQEVVLTGVDLTSYGHDMPDAPSLAALITQLLDAVPALRRLRLSSIDASEVDDALFALLTEQDCIMPYVHLSLQSGDDLILKRMKRRHSRAQSVALVQRLRAARPDIVIGADLIAGFPTESDAAFANSRALIDDAAIVHAHIFPYSPRAGTPAARMPQLPSGVARDRAAILRNDAANRHRQWLQTMIGSTQPVLVENDGLSGYTPGFARVKLNHPAPPRSISEVFVTTALDQHLIGKCTA